MGILCFVTIYGVKILDVTYDGWLMRGDFDLLQHYVGWGHYRNSDFAFPIGLISTLSYPFSMSVIYTDSIPMAAVFFKLLSPVLPETFQYFGLCGLISFILMGGFSMLLVHRFVANRIAAVLASLFFIVNFPILQRMYYHTALASHWIIILALVLWFYGEVGEKAYKKCIKWGVMGFICVGVHSYFLPMAGAIMLFSIIDDCIEASKLNIKPLKKSIFEGILEIASFCVMAILNLWILGGFYGGTSAIGGGIGSFESNLNTFINPLGMGITGVAFPTVGMFQYEGFAYLGIGMLFLMIVLLGTFVCISIIGRKKTRLLQYLKIHHRKLLVGILFILFFILSTGPIFTFNSKKIIGIPLPGPIGKIADIFRSNGRFIWVSFYVLMLAVFAVTDKIMKKGFELIFVTIALAIQLIDLSPEVVNKQEYFNPDVNILYVSLWEDPLISKIIEGKEEFIIMDSTPFTMMDSAYYAFKHNMITNCCYYARDIDDKVNEQRNIYEKELLEGKSREDAVYVFLTDDYKAGLYPDLIIYEKGKHVIGVKRK